jgi:hypothetical protein
VEELPELVRQPESESAQDAVEPNDERDENLLREESAVAEEQRRLAGMSARPT